MTTAEKLQKIAENEQKVYDKGYSDGAAQGGGGGSYDQGFEDGKQAEYDALWDTIQPNKNGRASYEASFGVIWKADIFKPKYDMKVSSAVYMFAYNQIGGDLVEYFERLGKKLDFSECNNQNATFQASKFTRLGEIYCTTANWYNCFNGCTELETIDEWGHPTGGEVKGGLTGCFTSCSKLKNLTVKGELRESINLRWSPLLSKASIESVVTHLADENLWTTATFSATAVNNAFETSQGAADGSASTEWLNLIEPKRAIGWTFSLV